MRTLFFPLICFSVITPLGIIFSSFSEYMTNIFRSLTSLMILISLILFFFKTNNLKRGIVPLIFMFYIVCFALVTIFFCSTNVWIHIFYSISLDDLSRFLFSIPCIHVNYSYKFNISNA